MQSHFDRFPQQQLYPCVKQCHHHSELRCVRLLLTAAESRPLLGSTTFPVFIVLLPMPGMRTSNSIFRENLMIVHKSIDSETLYTAACCSKPRTCGLENEQIHIHDGKSRELVWHPMTGHGSGVVCIVLSYDERQKMTGSLNNMVRVWDVDTALQIGCSFNLTVSD